MDDKKVIGDRVRRTRRAQDLTQERLAETVGIAHSTLVRIEKGVTMPSTRTVFNLAEALAVDPKWLLSGDEEGTDQ